MIHLNMQRFKFIDFIVIEVRFFKRREDEKHGKNVESTFLSMSYITDQPIFIYWLFFHTFLTLISLKVKMKSGFQWG